MNTAPDVKRPQQLNIRLSEEEAERLDRVAKHHSLNAAGLIRMLVKHEDDKIRREHPEAAAALPSKPSRRK